MQRQRRSPCRATCRERAHQYEDGTVGLVTAPLGRQSNVPDSASRIPVSPLDHANEAESEHLRIHPAARTTACNVANNDTRMSLPAENLSDGNRLTGRRESFITGSHTSPHHVSCGCLRPPPPRVARRAYASATHLASRCSSSAGSPPGGSHDARRAREPLASKDPRAG